VARQCAVCESVAHESTGCRVMDTVDGVHDSTGVKTPKAVRLTEDGDRLAGNDGRWRTGNRQLAEVHVLPSAENMAGRLEDVSSPELDTGVVHSEGCRRMRSRSADGAVGRLCFSRLRDERLQAICRWSAEAEAHWRGSVKESCFLFKSWGMLESL
jgi:hypothetical protein